MDKPTKSADRNHSKKPIKKPTTKNPKSKVNPPDYPQPGDIFNELPLAEQYTCVNPKASKIECIKRLREIAEEHPERIISRNLYRIQSGIPERTWRNFFGSFRRLKEAANITVSRSIKNIETYISKHSSRDQYRKLSEVARQWGDRYLRPTNGRWQTIVAASDFHDIHTDPFALRVLLDTAKRAQPETICLVGDVFDGLCWSKYINDIRDWKIGERYKMVHEKIFAPLRKNCPNAQIDFLIGNHDQRMLRSLADQSQALQIFLSEIHGMTLTSLFGLKQYEINLWCRSDLAAWTERSQKNESRKNYKTYFDCFSAVHETKDALRMQMAAVSGHQHKYQAWTFRNINGTYSVVQMGAMCVREIQYTDAENWSNGFAIINIDRVSKQVLIEYVPIGMTGAVVGGRFYQREKSEI